MSGVQDLSTLDSETLRAMLTKAHEELDEKQNELIDTRKAHQVSETQLQDAQAKLAEQPQPEHSTLVTVADYSNLKPPMLRGTTNEDISEFLRDYRNRYLVNIQQAKLVEGGQ